MNQHVKVLCDSGGQECVCICDQVWVGRFGVWGRQAVDLVGCGILEDTVWAGETYRVSGCGWLMVTRCLRKGTDVPS